MLFYILIFAAMFVYFVPFPSPAGVMLFYMEFYDGGTQWIEVEFPSPAGVMLFYISIKGV